MNGSLDIIQKILLQDNYKYLVWGDGVGVGAGALYIGIRTGGWGRMELQILGVGGNKLLILF